MIRVLQIVDHMGLGGIQAFIMNVYRNLDRSQIQFDFLVHKMENNTFSNQIEELGGKMYSVPARNQGIFKNKRALDKFFKEHPEYKVVHLHESSLSYIEPLNAAKNNNVPVRIIHSHNTRMGSNPIHRILHRLNSKRIHSIATHYLACGKMAGEWLYGKSNVKQNFQIVYNGVSLKDYEFSESIRTKVRNELSLGDATVLCHIGRFDHVKNHEFLIDIFHEFVKLESNSKLVLVGNGTLIDIIKAKVNTLNLTDKVLFLGLRNDVNRILQAIDAVVLPSYYEGFPVVAIEAQATGASFFMSDRVTREALIKGNSFVIPLDQSPQYWASEIFSHLDRDSDNLILNQKGLDISCTVEMLSTMYKNE